MLGLNSKPKIRFFFSLRHFGYLSEIALKTCVNFSFWDIFVSEKSIAIELT